MRWRSPEVRLLIVEDEVALLQSLQRALVRQGGHQVQCAHSGLEALRVLDRWLPDVVVSDVQMPGMSGLELRAQITMLHGDLPVVLMSGTLPFAGAGVVLRKPFAVEELVQVCRARI